MATLINKANPQIRITAPEIEEITSLGYTNYEIKQEGTFPLLFSSDIWNLVEEEYIKNRNDGTFTFVSTKEEPTEGIKGNLEEIPSNVDLEKEIENKRRTMLLNLFGPMNGEQGLAIRNFARHFYELGLKARKEEELWNQFV